MTTDTLQTISIIMIGIALSIHIIIELIKDKHGN